MKMFVFRGLIAAALITCAAIAHAQSYPLPITDRALMNPEMLHARDWPPTLGLPPVAITRTDAGERWFQIETSRDNFSPTFGNLFTPGTGWVDIARKYGTDLIYTFNTVPAWAVHQSGRGPAKSAPYDIDQKNERCQGPLDGQTSPDGNCIWKEWITALMQKDCGVGSLPRQPITGKCAIRNFEAWNEFNTGVFWEDSLTHLAKMANDMAVIVRSYCGDCTIIGGSASAGGVGRGGNGPAGSGSFDVALGEFLDAWHKIPNASLPDVVSFHSYPARTNVFFPPFPETNVSLSDPKCTPNSVPNIFCQYSVAEQPARVRRMLAARRWLPPTTPIWNTESGYVENHVLIHGVDDQGHADEITGILRQAYLARMEILLANEGVAVNIWYSEDHQCDGTLYGFGAPPSSPFMVQCQGDPVVPKGITPAGYALIAIYKWLHGGTFTGPCKAAGTVWSCPVTGPSIGNAVIAWTTRWDGKETGTISGTYKYAHTLDGRTQAISPGQKPLLMPRPRLFNDKP